jgi:hypothetical protein
MTDVVTAMPADPVPVPEAVPAPAELDLPLSSLRQAVLDHLQDTEEPQSVAQILGAMPAWTSRNTLESCLRRAREAGEIERSSPGHYVLAKPRAAESKPVLPASSTPEPEPEHDEATWFSALESWLADPSTWPEELGALPNDPANKIPRPIKVKFNDRLRKRQARQPDAEAAADRARAADAELRDRLIEAAGGNVEHGPGLDDLAPVRAALALGVPLDDIVFAVRCRHHRECLGSNPPLTTWRSEKLLKLMADLHCRATIVPGIVSSCMGAKPGQAAARTAAQPAGAPEASPAGQQVAADAESVPAVLPEAPDLNLVLNEVKNAGDDAGEKAGDIPDSEAEIGMVDGDAGATEPDINLDNEPDNFHDSEPDTEPDMESGAEANLPDLSETLVETEADKPVDMSQDNRPSAPVKVSRRRPSQAFPH